MSLSRLGVFVAGVCLSFGCGDSSGDSQVGGAREAGKAECARYLDCVLEVAPETVAPFLMSYGPEGECWNSADLQVLDICKTACENGREGLGKLFPDVGVCGECQSDDHCGDADEPYCYKKRGDCVECINSDQCGGGVCDDETHECVECLADADCETACDVDARVCVGCLLDEHCPGGVCDNDRLICVGCTRDSECAFDQRCEQVAGECVDCLTDGDCLPVEACLDNACVKRDVVCEPGTRRCTDMTSELCTPDGQKWTTFETCFGGEVCDPETGTCVFPVICTPGNKRCNFEPGRIHAEACNDAGTHWEITEDCDKAGMTCSGSKCVGTTYGPCSGQADDCYLGTDICTYGADSLFYCQPVLDCSDAADCPIAYPENPDYERLCTDGVCQLRCDPAPCPNGMVCAHEDDASPGVCAWDL